MKKMIWTGILTLGVGAFLSGAAHAATYVEVGDAGETLATASATAATAALAGMPLTAIYGTISDDNDADLFRIDITSTSLFSATTNNTVTNTSGVDTELFLFDSSGNAVEANDDNAANLTSTLPVNGTYLAKLNPGIYYLGIAESGNDPVNSANQELFETYPGGDTTALLAAATGLNPTTLDTFNSNSDDPGPGAYEVDLTDTETVAAAPEPATWNSLLFAGIILAFGLRLRRKPCVA